MYRCRAPLCHFPSHAPGGSLCAGGHPANPLEELLDPGQLLGHLASPPGDGLVELPRAGQEVDGGERRPELDPPLGVPLVQRDLVGDEARHRLEPDMPQTELWMEAVEGEDITVPGADLAVLDLPPGRSCGDVIRDAAIHERDDILPLDQVREDRVHVRIVARHVVVEDARDGRREAGGIDGIEVARERVAADDELILAITNCISK